MLCEVCKKNDTTVQVIDVKLQVVSPVPPGAGVLHVIGSQRHLCEVCAQQMKLPFPFVKNAADVWKLIQAAQNPQRVRPESGATCPECGMTLRDFRQTGRLGCPQDYEVFGVQLRELLERIHGATHHVGRSPGADNGAVKRMQRMGELQVALDAAIREEAYEAAARLRDEIRALQRS